MGTEYLAHVEACVIEAPPLLYYSHISSAAVVFLIGLFVYFKKKSVLESNLLFLIAIFFALWNMADIILWMSIDVRLIGFTWSLVNAFEMIVSLSTLYFAYAFLEKRDVSLGHKLIGLVLLVPYLLLIPTAYNIAGFDLALCEAVEGPLISYYYFFEILVSLWLLAYLVRRFLSSSKDERRITGYFSLGVLLFLLSFSGANVLASVTENWNILNYGLIGAPIFVAFLAYLIVRYQVFNVKLISTQALVLALIILIGSQFFFIKTPINFVLTGITFVLVTGAGYMLIRSVKMEVQRKEELQAVASRLAVANEELRKLDNAKSEFISIASHQLRTPLTAIKGFLSLLIEGSYGKLSREVEDVLNKVYVENMNLIELVEDLLNVSRIESGRIQYQFAPTSLDDILHELEDAFAISAQTRGLSLSFEYSDTPMPAFLMDRSKIREVISNLIDNALKYTKEGGVTVRLEGDSATARVVVSDTGVGIAAEDLPNLFQKFRRGKESSKINVSGTGLGLYVGKSFAEAHNGRLFAESEGVGKGSRFILELPIRTEEGFVGTEGR